MEGTSLLFKARTQESPIILLGRSQSFLWGVYNRESRVEVKQR
jgi:hypothetical protein